jgi:flagellar motor protein MotB
MEKNTDAEDHFPVARARGHKDVLALQNRIGALAKKLAQLATGFGAAVENKLRRLQQSFPALREQKATYQSQLADLKAQATKLEDRLARAQHGAPKALQEKEEIREKRPSVELRQSARTGTEPSALGNLEPMRDLQDTQRPTQQDEAFDLEATGLEGLTSLLQKEQEERHEKIEQAENTTGGLGDSTKPPEGGGETLFTITLGAGLFRSGQTRVTPQLAQAINDAADQIEGHPHCVISVEGHTDNVPLRPAPHRGFSDNMGLSLWRATMVAAKLAEVGVNPKRIRVAGYGQSRPLASNDTAAGRAKNRRVEIRVLKPVKPSPSPVTGD